MDTLSGIGVLDKCVAILDAVGEGPATLRDLVDRTSEALQFWVDQADDGRIGWICFVAEKPVADATAE
jgi:hypothetical protein